MEIQYTRFNITDEELRTLYTSGISAYELAKQYQVNKKTVLDRLHKFPDWEELKWKFHGEKIKKKLELRTYKGICANCGIYFLSKKTRKYCSNDCYKSLWQKQWRKQNADKINKIRRERRRMKEKKQTEKIIWLEKFRAKAGEIHKRNLDRFATRMMNRCGSWKNSLVSRSKKSNTQCNITIEQLRQLMYENYGKPCKYCGRTLDVNNIVIDHIVPVSKGGSSDRDNLQIICKTSNSMKGSLDENSFKLLLDWLETVPQELKKDISIRLSRGIH